MSKFKTLNAKLTATASPIGVDEATGTLRGVILVEKGAAKFWAEDPKTKSKFQMFIGDAFLDALAKLKSIAVRADPPPDEVHGGALAVLGEAINLRRDGDTVRADIQFIDPTEPAARKLLKLGAKAPHLAMMSLVFTYQVLRELTAKLREVVPVNVQFADFVSQGAATSALFSEEPEPVDTTDGSSMNYEFLRTLCAKLGISFPKTDAEVTMEIATKAAADVQAKLAAQDQESADLKAKLAEAEKKVAPQPVDIAKLTMDITGAVIAKLKAEGLAGTKGKPAAADPPADDDNAKLKADKQISALAAKLKAKPEELTAKLAKLTPRQQEVCFALELDPEQFAEAKEKYGKITETMPL
jgi:hypothetical protein